jgi:hypothetical protein
MHLQMPQKRRQDQAQKTFAEQKESKEAKTQEKGQEEQGRKEG